jgi:chemotaxis protein CheX
LDSKNIDTEFIRPFVEGAIYTIQVQCSSSVQAGKPFIKANGPSLDPDIAAVIELNTEKFQGSIAICFPQSVFLNMMGKMLGETYDVLTDELESGAGELLNIIYGQAKKALNEKGYKIPLAIPIVVRREGWAERKASADRILILPFSTDLGDFHMELSPEAN